MKRNKLFLLGLFVVFAAVLSLSLVSSTFARYTSNGYATDSARVAKWGVEVNVASDSAFGPMYKDIIVAEESAATVVAADSKDVLAPGTNGTLTSLTITGNPEVDVQVTVAFDLVLTGWEENGAYCPLVFTIGGTQYKIDATNTTVALLEAAIEAAMNSNATVEANGLDSSFDRTISWSWGFGTTDAENTNDTKLGNLATAPTVSYTLTVTVTQID